MLLLILDKVYGRKNEYIQKNNSINKFDYYIILCGMLNITLFVYVRRSRVLVQYSSWNFQRRFTNFVNNHRCI